jgi:Tol biopolymer transport system component
MTNNSAFFIPLVFFLLLVFSCSGENPLIPEDTTYNFSYQDSVLFRSNRSACVQISHLDGSGVRTICDTMASLNASWSSNKRKIIFVGSPLNDLQEYGIYIIDLKTYKPTRIASQEKNVRYAEYSPDMKYIAFFVYADTLGYKVKLFNLANSEIRDLTNWIWREIGSISWSPNSKDILIDDGYVININTQEMKVLFTFSGLSPSIIAPNWSPDGTKIAFSGNTLSGWVNIYIHDLITGETKILYEQNQLQWIASWSKDGSELLFDQRPSGANKSYLCKINVDGTNFIQLTDGYYYEFDPCWYK